MKALLRRLTRPSNRDPFNLEEAMKVKPLEKWKRNTFAIASGLIVGLYVGQYFPDVFYLEV